MIPKVIHYCWFGGQKKSDFIKKCMHTWEEVMPDYQLRCWSDSDVQHLISKIPFIQKAYELGQWAFVADYVRLYALWTEGGIYMDTDVKVVKPFDEYLRYSFFSGHEKHPFFQNPSEQQKLTVDFTLKNSSDFVEGMGILSAVMAAEPHLPYIKDCLDYYNALNFDLPKHSLQYYTIGKHITRLLLPYGYRFIDEDQVLKDNMLVKNSSTFVGNMIYYIKGNEYAIHLCNGSWIEDNKNWLWHLRNNHTILYSFFSPFLNIYNKLGRLFQHLF